MVASAHGDFQSLLKNPKLHTLVGGKTSVTVGDGLAIANGGSKVRDTERLLHVLLLSMWHARNIFDTEFSVFTCTPQHITRYHESLVRATHSKLYSASSKTTSLLYYSGCQ